MTYLESSYFFDFESEEIQNILSEFKKDSLSIKEKAIGIYTKVRDNWWYDASKISFSAENYKSSHLAFKQTANCVEKSILLISCLRGLGIPARLHLGKVTNHLAGERFIERVGSNEITPHGMVNACIENKWLKMSPAFNSELCKKFKVSPLDFDAENDSFLQQFNSEGTSFMEYTEDFGSFDDVPLDFLVDQLKRNYPHIFNTNEEKLEFEF